jgi:hypothetical protein
MGFNRNNEIGKDYFDWKWVHLQKIGIFYRRRK